MPNYRRATIGGATYFFTVNTYRRQPFLIDPDVRSALREGIERVRQTLPFAIDAWVLLPALSPSRGITCIASGPYLTAMPIFLPVGGLSKRPSRNVVVNA